MKTFGVVVVRLYVLITMVLSLRAFLFGNNNDELGLTRLGWSYDFPL